MSQAHALGDNLPFIIEITKGPHAGLRLEFHKPSITIGRGLENDVVLAEDPRVSRLHVEIKQSMGQFYVINLSQKNFILMNGANVSSEKIETKSIVTVGQTELRLLVQGSTNLLEPISSEPPARRPDATVHSIRPPVPPPYRPKPESARTYSGFAGPASPRPAPAATEIPRKYFVYIGVILLIGIVIYNKTTHSRRFEEKPFRTAEEMDISRQESENDIKGFQERKDKLSMQIYQKAYENFLRGYRDYRQGQYVRARESFQVVLNLDPENELAKRYVNLAKIRFDEIVKFEMLQGRRYLEKHNYRMCSAAYQEVMTMLGNDPSSPEYKEALMMHNECLLALEGRY